METAASVPLTDADKAVWQAISQPVASPSLAEVAKGRDSACIVISDITRPVPNQVILPPILETLEKAGISRDGITILIATGIHRPNEGEELEQMVGHSIMDSYRIVNHYSQKSENAYIFGQDAQRHTSIH